VGHVTGRVAMVSALRRSKRWGRPATSPPYPRRGSRPGSACAIATDRTL